MLNKVKGITLEKTLNQTNKQSQLRYHLDIKKMNNKCLDMQWDVGQFDWDTGGANNITEETKVTMTEFMSDIYWIEKLAAVAFSAMSHLTDNQHLKSVFDTFIADENRHAEAQRKLMERWGMVDKGATPNPNVNIDLLIRTIEKYPNRIHPSVLSAILPMTELVLDGTFVRFIIKSFEKDPLTKKVYKKINEDEARHLAIDFFVVEKFGHECSMRTNVKHLMSVLARPSSMYTFLLGYIPLLSRARKSMIKAGVDLEDAKRSMSKYVKLGQNSPMIKKHPTYKLMNTYAKMLVKEQYFAGDFLLRISETLGHFKNPFAIGKG